MTVQAPNEYRGAIVEGYLSGINRSGKITGRSQITFNFERIKLANGQTYDFAGFLQSVTDENGKTVKVDSEGTAQGKDQTKETVTRSGIARSRRVIGLSPAPVKARQSAQSSRGAGAGSVMCRQDDLNWEKRVNHVLAFRRFANLISTRFVRGVINLMPPFFFNFREQNKNNHHPNALKPKSFINGGIA